MRPPAVPLDKIQALPLIHRVTIPPEYEDENHHMNIRWYLAIFDDAGYPFVDSLGLSLEFHQQHHTGGFDLEHHIHYLNEVRVGDEVTITVRLLERGAKRIHYMMFMINETRGTLASIFECINSFADLSVRRTAPYPEEISRRIDALLAQHQALEWDAPECGVMRV